ncbi:MAG TPA: LuxR C-terminal-related transcriptional regulator [Candidatus Cybelea sp.]|nr:LuxR C-terminal-related transcriptional regulator [Candidatus Cybelea sp.]
MSRWLEGVEDRLAAAEGLGARLDAMLAALGSRGFTSLGYDYTPVPTTPDGAPIPPSLLEIRNIDAEMPELWVNGGFCQIDPMQELAIGASSPFLWSCNRDADTSRGDPALNALVGILEERHRPVIRYLKDTRMTIGVTVPMRLAAGGLATFNAVRIDPEPGFEKDARYHLREVALAGYAFHNAALECFDPASLPTRHVKLSPRETECLKLCAKGMTAKQIAFKLDRSPATVMLHLKSATRKLGARNRVQAVARAAHYRLLDGAC